MFWKGSWAKLAVTDGTTKNKHGNSDMHCDKPHTLLSKCQRGSSLQQAKEEDDDLKALPWRKCWETIKWDILQEDEKTWQPLLGHIPEMTFRNQWGTCVHQSVMGRRRDSEWSPAQKVHAVSEFWPFHVCAYTILLESVPRIQMQGIVQVKAGTSKSVFCAASHWSLMDHEKSSTSRPKH